MLGLQTGGDLRALIGLVESWSAVEEPTAPARLAQARALVRLGLVDRAWARIQGLVSQEGASAESLALTAELFLARQWPKRAREVLSRGLEAYPDDPALRELWDRMAEPSTTPDLDALSDEEADLPSLVTAAHHLIAAGSHTRARTVLERAQRLEPRNELVLDMLWALDGDFALPGSLAELVERFEPNLATLADFEEEPDHTESFDDTQVGAPLDREDKGSGNFPNLFRDLEPRTEMISSSDFDDTAGEITKVTSMMDIGSLDTIVDSELTGEHTEIQRVISRGNVVEDMSSETAFDLSSLRSDLSAPEAEDDDVVVMTRREETEPGKVSDETSRLVLADEPSAPVVSPGRQQPDEAESWVLPVDDASRDPSSKRDEKSTLEVSSPSKTESIEDLQRAYGGGSSASMWLLALGGVLVVCLVTLLLVVGLGLVTG